MRPKIRAKYNFADFLHGPFSCRAAVLNHSNIPRATKIIFCVVCLISGDISCNVAKALWILGSKILRFYWDINYNSVTWVKLLLKIIISVANASTQHVLPKVMVLNQKRFEHCYIFLHHIFATLVTLLWY